MRLLVADDQLLFRTMLEEMLKKDKDIDIIASASNGKEAVDLTKKYKPDMVLLDLQMPVKTGIEALVEIKASLPDTKVIILTTFEDSKNISAACCSGADGYLVKDMKPEALSLAVKCLQYDMVVFHKAVYETLSEHNTLGLRHSSERVEINDCVFDAIDLAIIRMIVEGKTNREIASSMNYSEGTIKNRVSKILSMTGLLDRTQVSVFAIKNQIV